MNRGLGVMLLTLLASLALAQGEGAGTGDFAGLVDIGGRGLYLECQGKGSPTVILEAGFRTHADFWSDDLIQPDAPRTMVFPGVAQFTRVCSTTGLVRRPRAMAGCCPAFLEPAFKGRKRR